MCSGVSIYSSQSHPRHFEEEGDSRSSLLRWVRVWELISWTNSWMCQVDGRLLANQSLKPRQWGGRWASGSLGLAWLGCRARQVGCSPPTPSSRHSSCPSQAVPQAGDSPSPSRVPRRTGVRFLGQGLAQGPGRVEDRQAEGGQHSKRSFLLSLSFPSFLLLKNKIISLISHDLENWPESCVWLLNGLWLFPAGDVEPSVT